MSSSFIDISISSNCYQCVVSSDLQYYINSHTNAHISPISSSAHSAITEQTNRQSLQNVSLNINTNPNVCSPLLSTESTSHSIDPLILPYDTNTPLHPDSGVVNVVHGDIVGATREIEPTSCDRHAIAEPQQTTRPIHSGKRPGFNISFM